MRVLVTGVNGFVGKHLARELKNRTIEVIGLGREAEPAEEISSTISDYWQCDLMDQPAISKLQLQSVDAIASLAGLAKVGDSFNDPKKYTDINVGVLTNICQAVNRKRLSPRIIAVSTGLVYEPDQPLPLTEQSKLASRSASPYALSKLAMEKSAEEFQSGGLDIIIVRPFNHIGPGQEAGFIVPDLYAKLKTAGSNSVIEVGNLKTKRDYSDVRDVVRAYADLIVASGLKDRLFNICSGQAVSGQQILETLMELTGINVSTESDPNLIRPHDIAEIYGSSQRLQKQTGWQPRISLEQSLQDFVNSQN